MKTVLEMPRKCCSLAGCTVNKQQLLLAFTMLLLLSPCLLKPYVNSAIMELNIQRAMNYIAGMVIFVQLKKL